MNSRLQSQNERYDELKLAPDWSFCGEDYLPLMELWKQTERLLSRHPSTTFLFIHLGLSEDLDYMEKLLGSLEGECHPPPHRCAAQALLRQRRADDLRSQGHRAGRRSSRPAASIVDARVGALTAFLRFKQMRAMAMAVPRRHRRR